MLIDLRQFSSSLALGDDGIWHSQAREAISYPSGGNEACFALEDGSFWFRHRNACIAEVVRRLPPAGPLFDVGGGNGFVSSGLVGAGIQTVLVEPGIDGARAARRRGLTTVACATLAAAGFKAGSLPGVGLFDVVEHIEDDLSFLHQVASALQPQGRVYLTVPAYRWLWSDEDVQAGHFRRHTDASLTSVLQRAGLEVEYLTYFFRWLPLPILLLRTLPSAIGLRRSAAAGVHQAEHSGGSSKLRGLVDRLLAGERSAIGRGERMAFGGSILAVARLRGDAAQPSR